MNILLDIVSTLGFVIAVFGYAIIIGIGLTLGALIAAIGVIIWLDLVPDVPDLWRD